MVVEKIRLTGADLRVDDACEQSLGPTSTKSVPDVLYHSRSTFVCFSQTLNINGRFSRMSED
jgi:hypothetical protein